MSNASTAPDPNADYAEQSEDNTGTSGTSRGWFIALGVLLILTGTGALIFPLLATFSAQVLAAATLLAGGVVTLVHAFKNRGWRGFALEALLGLLYIGGGLILFINPLAGMIALTVLLGAMFAADGIARILLALRIRPERSWWAFLISGGLSLVLGALVLLGLPSGYSLAFLGLMVGINMIFAGFSFLACTGENANCAPLGRAG